MKTIGKKIYFDKTTGKVVQVVRERYGKVVETTLAEDIKTFRALSERNPETFDYVELEYGQYRQDFAECNGYRVNPDTKELEFSYPDPNEPEVEQPYQAPLSERIEELKQENELLKARDKALSERADFIEDVVAEMATQVYQ